MTDFSSLSTPELANRIAILRDNLRQLTEQAAAQSGAANEERLADRIETQSKELDELLKEQERRGWQRSARATSFGTTFPAPVRFHRNAALTFCPYDGDH